MRTTSFSYGMDDGMPANSALTEIDAKFIAHNLTMLTSLDLRTLSLEQTTISWEWVELPSLPRVSET